MSVIVVVAAAAAAAAAADAVVVAAAAAVVVGGGTVVKPLSRQSRQKKRPKLLLSLFCQVLFENLVSSHRHNQNQFAVALLRYVRKSSQQSHKTTLLLELRLQRQ